MDEKNEIYGYVLACCNEDKCSELLIASLEGEGEEMPGRYIVFQDLKMALKEAVEMGTDRVKKVKITIMPDETVGQQNTQ